MPSPTLLFLACLLPATALRLGQTSDEIAASDVVYIGNPLPTVLSDITESLQDTATAVEHAVNPVQMVNFPSLTIMTGDDKLSKGMQASGANFETQFVRLLLRLWKENGQKGNLLDVGANMGAFTLPFAHALSNTSNAVLISVEALPNNRHLLRASMKYNKLSNMRLYEYAVGNTTWDDTAKFWAGGGNSGHAAYSPKRGNVEVKVTTLDSILNQDKEMKKIFAMKIDIEGVEPSALDGGKRWLLNYPPCVILTEMNKNDGGVHDTKLHNTIVQWGYERDDETTKVTGGPRSRNVLYKQKDMKRCVDRL